MNDQERYDSLCALARTTSQELLTLGADEEFASSIRTQIERKAGSYLPPITGRMSAALSEALVKGG